MRGARGIEPQYRLECEDPPRLRFNIVSVRAERRGREEDMDSVPPLAREAVPLGVPVNAATARSAADSLSNSNWFSQFTEDMWGIAAQSVTHLAMRSKSTLLLAVECDGNDTWDVCGWCDWPEEREEEGGMEGGTTSRGPPCSPDTREPRDARERATLSPARAREEATNEEDEDAAASPPLRVEVVAKEPSPALRGCVHERVATSQHHSKTLIPW